MNAALTTLALRLRLAMGRAGAPACAALALLVAGALAWLWIWPQQRALARARLPAPAAVPLAAAAAPPDPARALHAFYANLGERRYVEQQVATLFALAARHGLEWNQGDYKEAYDAGARVHTYRIDLPLKGTDAAIWRFCSAAMLAMPYAALDDISFKREAIGDAAVEARLRLTLYLADAGERP